MKKQFLISAVLSLLVPFSALAFSDVNSSTTYSTAIQWMTDNGVIQGYSDGTFKPDQCVNRAEFLKMLYITDQKPLYTEQGTAGSNYYKNYFSDVDATAWYWPYVNTALRDSIIQGYPDKTFKPEQCVNRVEAIKMAVLGFNDGKVPEADGYAGISLLYEKYRDIDYNQWYGPYMRYVLPSKLVGEQHEKVVNNPNSDWGTDRYFDPAGGMSRKEVAEMLYRMKALKDAGPTHTQYTPELVPKAK